MPAACRVAAVLRMMKNAIRFEKPMPTYVSNRMRASDGAPPRGVRQQGAAAVACLDRAQIFHLLRGLPKEQVRTDWWWPNTATIIVMVL